MNAFFRSRWLLVLLMAAAVLTGAWLARGLMLVSTRTSLTQRYQQQIAVLPERQAVRVVRQLGQNDQWIDVLVSSSFDERRAVAAAATELLREMVDRWAALPLDESSLQVAQLAHSLARQMPQVAAERRHLAHSLAERLIEWPVDGRRVDAAQVIADCASVLLLSRAEPLDATQQSMAESGAAIPAKPVVEPPAEVRMAAAPALRTPPTTPEPPAPLPEANAEVPVKPLPFSQSGPMRIFDDCN